MWLSGDGVKLASIALDDQHSLLVWDWKKGQKLASSRVSGDKIFGVKWNRFDNNQLVTVGVRHIRFWTQTGAFPFKVQSAALSTSMTTRNFRYT